jgi:type I restriction enzyme M protein
MNVTASQIGNRVWNMAHVLKDDGLSYLAYVEQITYLLFLKMSHELTQKPYKRPVVVPAPYDWPTLCSKRGAALEKHYQETLENLSQKKGLLGIIFLKAKPEIQDPAKLHRLIHDLIEPHTWVSMTVDVKGAIYEELLSRTAKESPSGAGQYFTPRPVIDAMVAAMQPGPDDTVCDPAAGTAGFLLAVHDYVVKHYPNLNPDQMRHVKENLVFACELVPTTARLCAMNLHLHGIGGKSLPLLAGHDSLATKPDRTFSIVVANPPFGKKGSLMNLDDEGNLEREQQIPVRDDFWISTSNKQFNFVQHIHTLLKTDGGRAGVVLPDNVLFEGGGGETLRRHLLKSCDVHTLLRLPTGIFYKPGVKANVLFFDKKPGSAKVQTKKLWVYDLRTNLHFTLKQKPITLADFDEFLACYRPGALHKRKPTWSKDNPDGRWRSYDWAELEKRDKLDLDLTWLKDESIEDGSNLPEPDELADEMIQDLQNALELLTEVAQVVTKRPV